MVTFTLCLKIYIISLIPQALGMRLVSHVAMATFCHVIASFHVTWEKVTMVTIVAACPHPYSVKAVACKNRDTPINELYI